MKKLNKRWLAVIPAAAAGLLLAACGNSSSSTSSKKQTLNWMASTEVQTLDVSKVTDATSVDQLNNSLEGLYRLGNNAKVENALATSTKVSKDGKTWVFTLRKNAKWSNGDPVTAKDFVYSWRRTVNPKTASEYAYLFEGIKNAAQITAGKKPVSSLGIKADGKYKLTVTLDKRIPYFKLLMGFAIFFPENENAVKKYGSKYGTASKYMVYNGPFVQKGWTGSNLSWKLVKNKNYWDKKHVKLDTINYSVQKTPSTSLNLYQSNKLDVTLLDAQGSKNYKGKSGYVIRKKDATQYLEPNLKKDAFFKNAKLRQAFSMAINRSALSTTLGGANLAARTVSPEGISKVNGEDYTTYAATSATKAVTAYNPTKAKKLFKEAMKELGKSKLSLTLVSYDDDVSKKAAEFVQSQLESNLKGVTVTVQSIPKKSALSRMQSGNFDLALTGWFADFSDPISFLDLFTTNNSYNFGHWSNTSYDKLIAQTKTEANTAKRYALLKQAEDILVEQEGVIPLYHADEAWLVRSDVKGVVFNGAGSNYSFKDAYIK
ncbi:peptide ABC transporter substrate-binding protein [Lactobacillus corticis]|uniref:Oligopeptide ABC transporter substrate-binding protein n=1 Tax=Lactobacillus corticis TaxID=2201249 RepID=A0A916QIS9_9LACO|nr:peptide ABC transporter substrate-binding protein [Lactobacillus corticis]GFZ26902.1 oligopeptide ABC transporter substrate-binding protein [Lactobacillus corticis]